jgi:hypothetical protein
MYPMAEEELVLGVEELDLPRRFAVGATGQKHQQQLVEPGHAH